MSDKTLATTARADFGKGASRRIRREGMVPAVLYGHGTDPIHLAVPAHATYLMLRTSANALFELDIDGRIELALAKDVQRDPIKNTLEHIDFIIVKRGEKVEVEVPVEIIGESAPGTIHTVELQTIRLLAEATAVPQAVIVDITGFEAGRIVHTGSLDLPAGTSLVDEDDLQVVNVLIPRAEVAEESEEEAPATMALASDDNA